MPPHFPLLLRAAFQRCKTSKTPSARIRRRPLILRRTQRVMHTFLRTTCYRSTWYVTHESSPLPPQLRRARDGEFIRVADREGRDAAAGDGRDVRPRRRRAGDGHRDVR